MDASKFGVQSSVRFPSFTGEREAKAALSIWQFTELTQFSTQLQNKYSGAEQIRLTRTALFLIKMLRT